MRTADTFWKRFWGLMFQKKSPPIHLPRCRTLHTFFVQKKIHLTWLDKNQRIIKEEVARPWKIYHCHKAHSVIERFYEDDEGQALVELALTLPLILLIIWSTFHLSLGTIAQQKLQQAAYYATNIGSLTNDDNKIRGALETFQDHLDWRTKIENTSRITQQNIPSNQRRYGDLLALEIEYDFPLPLNFLKRSHITLQAVAHSPILCQNLTPPYTCE